MTHLPALISDLALILIVASITTIIFKMLKQPLVLGYLVAGFMAGPHFHFLFTVSDSVNISTWAEIGIIFLLFALGLEFSIKKLTSVGHTAFITAITEVIAMIAVGYLCGQALGWNTMDSMFLGGMISMSSTIIIIKAFDDLKLKGMKFTHLVFGTLIIEDIVGIVMMVMIPTLAASAEISELSVLLSVFRLVFFLILWFILGIFIIPPLFRKVRKHLNNETLLIVSLGLCLGMVVLATNIGFSSALGAFITGSILAETREAERIERLLLPVKDLFGAVFFVSVGMMVNPAQLAQYALPIFIIVLATICGQIFFSTIGMLLSGVPLKIAMQGGFSLAQIGEFAFIIAGLGQSLGVTSDFLYPIVVAVSVITTFTTPFCVKLALPAYQKLNALLPKTAKNFLERYNGENAPVANKDKNWRVFLTAYFANLIAHSVLLGAITFFSFNYSGVISQKIPGMFGYLLETIIPLLIMSPFLKDLLFNKNSKPELVSTLWFKGKSNRLPLLVLFSLRVLIAMIFILLVLFRFLPLHPLFIIAIAAVIAAAIHYNDWLLGQYLRIEARFMINLNEKHLQEQREANAKDDDRHETHWLDEELRVVVLKVSRMSDYIGKTLQELSFRERFGVNLLQITRKTKTIDMPGGNAALKEGDCLIVLGTQAQLEVFCAAKANDVFEFEEIKPPTSLRQFILSQEDENDQLLLYAAIVNETSPLLGKSSKSSKIRDQWHCLVVGLERGVYTELNPNISLIFEKGDIVWVIGKSDMVGELAKLDLL